MSEITALALIRPLGDHPQPDLVLRLLEGHRASWHAEACSWRARPILASGGPHHQLAHGLLAALWRLKMLCRHRPLAALVTGERRRVQTPALDEDTARAVYRTAAGLISVDLTLYERSWLIDRDIELARECGVRILLADASTRDGAR